MKDSVKMEEIGEMILSHAINKEMDLGENRKKLETFLSSVDSFDQINKTINLIFNELGITHVRGKDTLLDSLTNSLSRIQGIKAQNEKYISIISENKNRITCLEEKLNKSEKDLEVLSRQIKIENNINEDVMNESESEKIESFKLENIDLKNQNNELKKKINKNSELELANQQLHIKIEELQALIQKKDNEKNLYKNNNEIEVKSLNSIIDGLRNTLSHQVDEILNESNNKIQLTTIVYKLMKAIQQFETIFSNMENINKEKENEYKTKIKLMANDLNSVKRKQNTVIEKQKTLFDNLFKLIRNKFNNEMVSLIDENNVLCIIDIINEIIHQLSEKNEGENDESLLQNVISENQKLFKISNINDDDNIIQQMLSINQVLNNFINENYSLIKRTGDVNDTNQENQIFCCNILSFLKIFTGPSNNESKLLFEVIKGLVAIINILISLSKSINVQNNSKELKLINELNTEHLENEKLRKDIMTLQHKILSYQNKLKKLRSLLIKYEKNYQNTKVKKEFYNQEQILQLTKENKNLVFNVKNLNNQNIEIRKSLESKIKENSTLQDTITNLQDNLLQKDNIIKSLKINLNESKNIIQDKKNTIEELRNNYLSHIQEVKTKGFQANKKFKKEYQQMLRKANLEIAEKTQKIESIKAQYESINQLLKNKLSESRDSSLQIQKELMQKFNECKDLETKLSSAKFENSMLSLKVEQYDKKLTKTQLYFEQKQKIMKLSYANQIESKIKDLQAGFIQEKNNIIKKIFKFLNIDENITYDNIDDVLQKISDELLEYERTQSKKKELESDMKKI